MSPPTWLKSRNWPLLRWPATRPVWLAEGPFRGLFPIAATPTTTTATYQTTVLNKARTVLGNTLVTIMRAAESEVGVFVFDTQNGVVITGEATELTAGVDDGQQYGTLEVGR